MMRFIRVIGIMVGMLLGSGGGVLGQAALADSLQAEIVRSRAFIRAAETQPGVLDGAHRARPDADNRFERNVYRGRAFHWGEPLDSEGWQRAGQDRNRSLE